MNEENKECIEVTDAYDIIMDKYVLPIIGSIISLWLLIPVLIELVQSSKSLASFSFIRLLLSLLLVGYIYYLTKPIVSCKVCQGYLLIKTYGKPVKVDFDNICSIDRADLIGEPGKNKGFIAIRFWHKTVLGQTVKVFIKKDHIYKGERVDGQTYLVKLINDHSIKQTVHS